MVSRLLFVTVWFALAGERVLAQTITSPYSVDFFTTDEGLPGHQVYDVAQTSDGYLWVATNGGLARFDGHRFLDITPRITPALESPIITDIYVGRGDTLFAAANGGPNTGSHIIRYVKGALDYYAETAPGGNLGNIAQDDAGRVLATTHSQLLRTSGSLPHMVPLQSRHHLIARHLASDADGVVWGLASPDTPPSATGIEQRCGNEFEGPWTLARLDADGFVPVADFPYGHLITHPSRGEVLRAEPSAEGLALSTTWGEARGSFMIPPTACPLMLGVDRVLWVQEEGTLVAYAPETPTPLTRFDLGFTLRGLPALFEDREGTLWIGFGVPGLIRIRRNAFQVYTPTEDTGEAIVSTVPGAQGTVILTDASLSVYRAAPSGIEPVTVNGETLQAQGYYEDDERRRLYTTTPESERERVFNDALGPSQPVFEFRPKGGVTGAMFYPSPHEEEVVWMYLGDRVYHVADPMSLAPTFTLVLDGLPSTRHLHSDRQGTLWVATEGGLVRFDGTRRTTFGTADGLPHPHVRFVHEDPDGVIWAGTYGGGVARFDGTRFAAVTQADGLAENVVASILEDEAGTFWMAGNQGVHRTPRAGLNAFLDGQTDRVPSVLYGRESGLVNPETHGTPAVQTPDGHLWFPTFYGAGVVDPTVARQLDQEPPIVHAQSLLVGDSLIEHTGDPIRLAADQRRFTVSYVGLSLRLPEHVTYRYRLDGLDPDWVEAGTERQTVYTNVPPGSYTFRVQARTHAGVWSEEDGVLALSVAPFFYETAWFLLLCGLTTVGLVVAGYRFRVQQLKSREAELNALVRERTDDLEREKETVAAQAEALRSLDEAKSRVFANISHEFRTPLTLILGPLEDLRDDLTRGTLGARGQRRVDSAISNGHRLLRLVNQLLDVSRLEAGRLALEARPLDAVAFVEHLAQAFAPFAESKHITFQIDTPHHPIQAYLDAGQFEKVVANLLGNAFKFTPEGGTVVLTLDTDEEADGPSALVLTVEDDGPGIAADHLLHLFERFYQADASSTRRQPGTGIGLALVKNLVEVHGGTVEAESEPGRGATFTVRVPLGRAHLRDEDVVEPDAAAWEVDDDQAAALMDAIRPARPPVEPDNEAIPEEHATTVLVVDDNPEVRAYVHAHLAPRYRVLEAADGQHALDTARTALPDLIVSDVMMPELDGFGLCRAIKEDPELDFIPVILLTARASAESKLEGLGRGADAYLTKPFNVRELEVRVENLIASRQRLKARFAGLAPADTGDGAPPSPSDAETDPFVAEVETLIAARLSDEDFGVSALAAALGLGRTTCYARIGEAFGCTPMELVWRMRLERAAALLRQREGTVSEVAYGVGFKNVAHFCTRFREAYGTTPAAYAAAHPA